VHGLFDVVMVEASYAGMLGDCLLDLYMWEPKIGEDFRKELVTAGVVDKRLGKYSTFLGDVSFLLTKKKKKKWTNGSFY
jgi:hypothetical protein